MVAEVTLKMGRWRKGKCVVVTLTILSATIMAASLQRCQQLLLIRRERKICWQVGHRYSFSSLQKESAGKPCRRSNLEHDIADYSWPWTDVGGFRTLTAAVAAAITSPSAKSIKTTFLPATVNTVNDLLDEDT